MAILKFSADPTKPERAIVVALDVAGFSEFCDHPDRHNHVPKFVSATFDKLDTFTVSQADYWIFRPRLEQAKIVAPDFIKYTGDGALMLWTGSDEKRFDKQFRTLLVATMRRFQTEFVDSVLGWQAAWCVGELPKRIRVGITMGTVFPLRQPSFAMMEGDIVDYAGYCINLAARLQSHCPEVGFLIQKCVSPDISGLEAHLALGIKGASEEPIWLFKTDCEAVQANVGYWKTKFRTPEQKGA